ncbi:MAG TPA: hypothetical protein VF789_31920 [Thermoanaerobaculia bacterium]
MDTQLTITQKSLARVHRHHPHRIRADQLADEEKEILAALKAGGTVQPGTHKVWLQRRTFQKQIRWRHEAEQLAKKLEMPTYVEDLEKEAAKTKKVVEYLVFE